MFAVGVDEMSWDDLNDAHYDWPRVAEVKAYRDQVREFVDGIIRRLPLKLPIDWDNPFWAIMMGIEHQRIHLETSSVIIRRMPIEKVRQLPIWQICPRIRPGSQQSTSARCRRQGGAGRVERITPFMAGTTSSAATNSRYGIFRPVSF